MTFHYNDQTPAALSTCIVECSMEMMSLFWTERIQFCDIFILWQEDFYFSTKLGEGSKITRNLDTSLQMSQLFSHARRTVKVKCGIHNFFANLESYYGIRFVIFALQVETWRTLNGIILSGTTSVQWQALNSVSAVKALSLFMPNANYFNTGQEMKPSKNLCLS
jgi:hypothetical protein